MIWLKKLVLPLVFSILLMTVLIPSLIGNAFAGQFVDDPALWHFNGSVDGTSWSIGNNWNHNVQPPNPLGNGADRLVIIGFDGFALPPGDFDVIMDISTFQTGGGSSGVKVELGSSLTIPEGTEFFIDNLGFLNLFGGDVIVEGKLKNAEGGILSVRSDSTLVVVGELDNASANFFNFGLVVICTDTATFTAGEITGDGEIIFEECGQPEVIGGKYLPLDNAALLLAGAQTFSWMIPVVLSGIGIGLFVFRKSENS